jgi:hypothetical protein
MTKIGNILTFFYIHKYGVYFYFFQNISMKLCQKYTFESVQIRNHIMTTNAQSSHVVMFLNDIFSSSNLIKRWTRSTRRKKSQMCPDVFWFTSLKLIVTVFSFFLPELETWNYTTVEERTPTEGGEGSLPGRKHRKYWWHTTFWRCPELELESTCTVWLLLAFTYSKISLMFCCLKLTFNMQSIGEG